jgi:hypothetical protein
MTDLSYRAAGLLAHLRALPAGPIDTAGLARPERREGRDAVRSMLRELAAAGHVEERRAQDPHGHWRTTTHLVTPGTEKPGPVDLDNTNQQVTPEPGNPAPDQPAPEKPFPVKTASPQVAPETDCPAPEKPGPSTCTPVGSTSSSTSVVNQNQSATRFPARTHTRGTTAAELNTTAVQPHTYALVSTWNNTLAVPLRPEIQRQLAKAVDNLLAAGRIDLHVLRTALDDWARRGHSPAFLKHCYDDAATTARAAQTLDVPGSRVHGRGVSRPSTTDQRLADIQALKHSEPETGRHLRALPGATG